MLSQMKIMLQWGRRAARWLVSEPQFAPPSIHGA